MGNWLKKKFRYHIPFIKFFSYFNVEGLFSIKNMILLNIT